MAESPISPFHFSPEIRTLIWQFAISDLRKTYIIIRPMQSPLTTFPALAYVDRETRYLVLQKYTLVFMVSPVTSFVLGSSIMTVPNEFSIDCMFRIISTRPDRDVLLIIGWLSEVQARLGGRLAKEQLGSVWAAWRAQFTIVPLFPPLPSSRAVLLWTDAEE